MRPGMNGGTAYQRASCTREGAGHDASREHPSCPAPTGQASSTCSHCSVPAQGAVTLPFVSSLERALSRVVTGANRRQDPRGKEQAACKKNNTCSYNAGTRNSQHTAASKAHTRQQRSIAGEARRVPCRDQTCVPTPPYLSASRSPRPGPSRHTAAPSLGRAAAC